MLIAAKEDHVGKTARAVVPETFEEILDKAKQYLKSRFPINQVPEDEEAFFAFALARLIRASFDPMDPEVVANSKKDYDQWKAVRELPYYILVWRELSSADFMHAKG